MPTTHTQDAPQLITGMFMSLDGVVEADGDWQFAYFDDELFAGISASWDRAGAALMGRHSFEGYDRLRRDHPSSPAVQLLDSVPKYVASTTLTQVEWSGTTVIGDGLEAELARLRTEHAQEVLVLAARHSYAGWWRTGCWTPCRSRCCRSSSGLAAGCSKTWSYPPGRRTCVSYRHTLSAAEHSSCATRSPDRPASRVAPRRRGLMYAAGRLDPGWGA